MPNDTHETSQARMKAKEKMNSQASGSARGSGAATKRLGPVANPSDGKAQGKYRAPLGG